MNSYLEKAAESYSAMLKFLARRRWRAELTSCFSSSLPVKFKFNTRKASQR